jgi:hypothetical protein
MNPGNLLNAALFQVAWFACVLGGARDVSSWGLVSVLALLVYALLAPTRRSDLTMGAVAAAVGFLVDTLWIRTGILDYHGAAVAPSWIVLLWVGVGLTINHSLSLFQPRPWLGGLLAGACAPVSYLAGERLGAVSIPDPWLLPIVSLVWAILFVVAFTLAGGAGRSTTVVPVRRDYERAR